jgi:hypothetical protein
MKKTFAMVMLAFSATVLADDAKNEWHNTTLKEETIKQIQLSQLSYKQCVAEEMQKKTYAKQESRMATDAIIKRCENMLGGMRQVYVDAGVPEVIADRHLKKMRIQTTRKLLQQMMFMEASRAAGAN